ncbi:hypothetical protein FRC08_011431 [Ceratobasidium sp. 394]|nr:hypothetical protein FRC08_011431 [Ceratobasidium sp. 394]KAG9099409.1 hypothetical protein FS749_001329 [Ceratobasidium sp. UAMH 11750]
MVYTRSLALLAIYLVSGCNALPILRTREVPQEHSHEAILRATNTVLKLDNPDNIQDAVFGLLGNAAASTGKGNIADPDCLQTATADRAFTNAKNANDVAGMTAALQYRALERNTGSVGLKSVLCTSFTPVNPEIAAITQHQDPASDGAAATNKAIVLELAKQIASIGGNPLDALQTGTFQPGQIGDPTARGNSCDDANDAVGCIISQNLIVFDATPDEINAAVSGVSAGGNPGTGNLGDPNAGTDCTAVAVTITVTASASATPSATSTSTSAAAEATTTPAAPDTPSPPPATSTSTSASPAETTPVSGGGSGGNLQTFTGALGGVTAPAVTDIGGGQFAVEGNSNFNSLRNALVRSCDVQNNQCANASNAAGQSKTFSVGDCNAQQATCIDQANSTAA